MRPLSSTRTTTRSPLTKGWTLTVSLYTAPRPEADLDLYKKFVQLSKPYVMMFSNRKGGCCKTGSCILCVEFMVRLLLEQLPQELHHLIKVLVVDMDPQADITRRLGVEVKDGDETIVDVLAGTPRGLLDNIDDKDMLGLATYAIKPCGWDDEIAQYIDVLPGHEDLELELEFNSGKNMSFTRLRNALHGATAGYQAVFIDCPPALHHITQMAMAVADGAVLVTSAEKDSVRALDGFFRNMLGLRNELDNRSLEVIGLIVANVLERTRLHSKFLDELGSNYGDDLWGAIPNRTRLAEAFSDAKPPLSYLDDARKRVHVTDQVSKIVHAMMKRAIA